MRVAKAEGWSILIIASMGAFVAASGGSFIPAIAACLVAGAGAMEIHGVQRLARGEAGAVNWLVGAQLLLMGVILAYALWRLTNFDEAAMRALRQWAIEFYAKRDARIADVYRGVSESDFVLFARGFYTLAYCAVGIATCVFQGLMARYYHRRRAAVAQALAE